MARTSTHRSGDDETGATITDEEQAVTDMMSPAEFARNFRALTDNVEHVVKCAESRVPMALVALLAEGHLLLEDLPGTGKTTLARALAASFGGVDSRIQFTPDLLPSDVTGVAVLRDGDFKFRPGPVFANIVIGDEINRASPKTQSALLEVMQERQVTYDGVAYAVPRPFMVIATQNPIEHHGTYYLPEAQLDRFLIKMDLGYPDDEQAVQIIDLELHGITTASIPAVVTDREATAMINTARNIKVSPGLKKYVVDLAKATRTHSDVQLGASPRATIALVRAAQVVAAANGRPAVTPADVKAVAASVLSHRLVLKASATGANDKQVVEKVLASVTVPVESNA